jgi:hypothetical protein
VPSRIETKIIDALLDPTQYKTTVTPLESPAELTARLQRETDEGHHRRRKDLLLTWTGIVVIVACLVVALIVALFPIGSPDDKSRAWTILTLIAGGFIGFLTGRQFAAGSTAEDRR